MLGHRSLRPALRRRHNRGSVDDLLLLTLGVVISAFFAGLITWAAVLPDPKAAPCDTEIGGTGSGGGGNSSSTSAALPRAPEGYRFEQWCLAAEVRFCVDPPGGPSVEPGLASLLQDAIDVWQGAAGRTLPLAVGGVCPGVGTASGDGVNVVGWAKLDDGKAALAAVKTRDGTVSEADIRIDLSEQPQAGWDRCLLGLLVHELGHVVGLDHQDHGPSIMQPHGSCQGLPSESDVAAIRFLYQ